MASSSPEPSLTLNADLLHRPNLTHRAPGCPAQPLPSEADDVSVATGSRKHRLGSLRPPSGGAAEQRTLESVKSERPIKGSGWELGYGKRDGAPSPGDDEASPWQQGRRVQTCALIGASEA